MKLLKKQQHLQQNVSTEKSEGNEEPMTGLAGPRTHMLVKRALLLLNGATRIIRALGTQDHLGQETDNAPFTRCTR